MKRRSRLLLNRERLHCSACGRRLSAPGLFTRRVALPATSGRKSSVTEDARFSSLRDDIIKMLAGALETEKRHASEMERRDQQHIAEAERRDELHVQELHRRDDLHAHELEMIRDALETRDLVGQAKGVIMAALSCSPDEAFHLLRQQSQHENRKLVEVAADIAGRASSRVDGPYRPPGET